MTDLRNPRHSIVLFSGGLDSTVCVAVEKAKGRMVTALYVTYGQQNGSPERIAAERIAGLLGATFVSVNVAGVDQVTDAGLLQEDAQEYGDRGSAFVPARNLFLLTFAGMYAHTSGAARVVIGASNCMESAYPDAQPEFVAAAELALRHSGVRVDVEAPLIDLSKRGVWTLARNLDVLDVARQSYTCYRGDTTQNVWGQGCGNCEACVGRARGYFDWEASA